VFLNDVTLIDCLYLKAWGDSVSLSEGKFPDFVPNVHLNFLFNKFTFREERMPSGGSRVSFLRD
jgi:hypothetical protein